MRTIYRWMEKQFLGTDSRNLKRKNKIKKEKRKYRRTGKKKTKNIATARLLSEKFVPVRDSHKTMQTQLCP